uniref:IraD/Gp25-like domain-containing protein n=1 Tax=Yersinia enterocolitica W22703 TaxID=913028 RepID=F4MYP8_YEREN|nr:unknown protein [Yersinia enterocolitica W22703]
MGGEVGLNYGISPLVGRHSTPHNWTTIERIIREAIIRFEPRVSSQILWLSISSIMPEMALFSLKSEV